MRTRYSHWCAERTKQAERQWPWASEMPIPRASLSDSLPCLSDRLRSCLLCRRLQPAERLRHQEEALEPSCTHRRILSQRAWSLPIVHDAGHVFHAHCAQCVELDGDLLRCATERPGALGVGEAAGQVGRISQGDDAKARALQTRRITARLAAQLIQLGEAVA